ncbi:hypothetical protein BZZ01_04580 [Nostocales cyanobacterium HT-58-2]|nr:hypothetical protein BZZ01_04580 [Nostocales cyanobacterium HT-58-2]
MYPTHQFTSVVNNSMIMLAIFASLGSLILRSISLVYCSSVFLKKKTIDACIANEDERTSNSGSRSKDDQLLVGFLIALERLASFNNNTFRLIIKQY